MEDFSQELGIIEKICYSLDLDAIDSRSMVYLLKDTIANALFSLGYNVVYDKRIRFKRFDERSNKAGGMQDGTLDMLFFRGKSQIAVEVNQSSVIRLKSAMKLISSDALLKIAVLYPSRSGIVKDEDITGRISRIKEAENMTRPIHIINLAEKRSYKV